MAPHSAIDAPTGGLTLQHRVDSSKTGSLAHRADQLTRPIRLNPWVIGGGAVITAAMFAMLGLGIGRNESSNDARPSRDGLPVPNIGGGNPASLARQIAITPDGSTIVFVTSGENGEQILASQRIGDDGPRLLGAAIPRLQSDLVARDGTPMKQSSLLARLRPDDRTMPEGASLGGARFQQMLPDRENALVVRPSGAGLSGAGAVRNIETGAERVLVPDGVVEMRAAAGHLVYAKSDGTLWAAPLSEEEPRLTAPPVQIGRGVSLTGSGIAQFAVSRNGNVAYVPQEPRWLVLVDRRGRLRNATPERGNYRSPRFSPDGRLISVDITGSDGRDIWLVSRESGSLTRGTFARDAHDATWTPDGRLTYTSFISGSLGIFRAVAGSRDADSLFASPALEYTGSWLRDGSGIVTTAGNLQAGSQSDIAFVGNEGRGPLMPVVADRSSTHHPALSPDGKWLAYVSNRSGRDELYVRPWLGEGDVQVSNAGGTEPVWSPDGRHLFYRGTNGRYPVLIEAEVSASPRFAIVSRNGLFPIGDIAAATPQANYDISPDGRTFVMVRLAPSSSITLLQNLPLLIESNRK